MSTVPLETVEVETGARPTASVVWLHGVGADGHQFKPLVGQLMRPASPPLRFIFPHAPMRRITLCNGEQMRGWYDLRNVNRQAEQDRETMGCPLPRRPDGGKGRAGTRAAPASRYTARPPRPR